MTTLNERIKSKFERLLSEAAAKGSTVNGRKNYDCPTLMECIRFRTEVLNLTRMVCGEQSDHYLHMRRLVEEKEIAAAPSFHFLNSIAILEAAQRDYEDGVLLNVRAVIAVEVIGDFLDQAEGLVAGGHYVAAVSLAGAVLEDSMRRLCSTHGITLPEKPNLNWLNTELARKGAYDNLVMKRITALAELRNNADHGHFDNVKAEDAKDLVAYVRRFCTDYLARKPD